MNKYIYFLAIAASFFILQTGLTEEGQTFTFNTWMSQGQTKWRHDASALDSDYGVPSSELDYQGVNSQVAEIGMLAFLPTGHSLNLIFGTGVIDEGTLVDDDYLSASGAVNWGATQSGAHRFSRTHSDINGSRLFYFKGEFTPQDFHINNTLADIRFSFSLHRWEEEYTATGIRQIECTILTPPNNCLPAGSSVLSGVTVITNKVEWTGVGIAMDSLFNLSNKLSFKLDLTYYPLMSLVNEDTHHRRSDLAQDPSIKMTGTGTGYDLTTLFQYQFSERFSFHLGYRLWERWVKNQTITFRGASGGSSSADLMDFRTRREGFMTGITLQFG